MDPLLSRRPGTRRRRPSTWATALLVVGLVALAAVPSAAAAPADADGGELGSVATADAPILSGTLDATAAGELQVRGPGGLLIEIAGRSVIIESVSATKSYMVLPNGAEVEVADDPAVHARQSFDDAGLRLSGEDAEDGFQAFVAAAALVSEPPAETLPDAKFVLDAVVLDDVRLMAYKDVRLVTDLAGGDANTQTDRFTYRVDGVRFPVDVAAVEAYGTMSLFVEHGAFDVTDTEGRTHHFTAGTWTQSTGPSSYDRGTTWFLVTVEATEAAFSGQLTAWMARPDLTLSGTLSSDRATGHIEIDGETVRDTDSELAMSGLIRLAPRPAGAFVASDGTNRIGTTQDADPDNREGSFEGIETSVSGDVVTLAFGAQVLGPGAESGAVVAAAALGAVSLMGLLVALSPNGKWLLGGALVPLYAKTEKNRLLDNASRERIYQAICANPGINLSQVNKLAELGWGVTVYHLKMLEKNGIVFSHARNRDRCFFENNARNRSMTRAISALANKDRVRTMAKAVITNPGSNQSELIEATGMSQRTASYYLSRLAKDGLVERRRKKNFTYYDPTDALCEAFPVVTGQVPPPAPEAVAAHGRGAASDVAVA